MIKMSEKSKLFLIKNCNFDLENCLVNDILDVLDTMMLDSRTDDYEPTEETRIIADVFDDIYINN